MVAKWFAAKISFEGHLLLPLDWRLMSTHEYIIALDCGGILANDIPGDMFQKLAEEHYSGPDVARVANIHARKYDFNF